MIYMDKNISLMDGFIALIKRFESNFVNIHRDGIKNWGEQYFCLNMDWLKK